MGETTMPVYNKLVRDKIPKIIERDGKRFSSRILGNEEYIKELINKSYEELKEYTKAENDRDAIEELADLLEIIHAFAECHGSTFDDVEDVRKKESGSTWWF